VTKVLFGLRGWGITQTIIGVSLAVCAPVAQCQTPSQKPAEALYLQLGQAGLDPARVYKVRGASLDRAAIHITLEDGTIGFTEDVMGKITGAFFEGEGEVLLVPPDEVERRSMSLFTGMAILEEHFATAYFRFNDDVFTEMRPDLRAPDDKDAFLGQWSTTAKNLAQTDAMRLLVSFSRLLPVSGQASAPQDTEMIGKVKDRFLHARLQGTRLGVFDIVFDSLATEQVQAGQERTAANGITYYDVWTSFPPTPSPREKDVNGASGPGNPSPREDWIAARHFTIRTEVEPPRKIHSRARIELEVREGGTRDLIFELSRSLQIESVTLDEKPVEFIHNPALEGTQLARRGNDIVAVILPKPAQPGQIIHLEFVYGGEVLAEAGGGLLYVGARGTWYPNRGLALADFDLEFTYPLEWTLVATGKSSPVSAENTGATAKGEQTSRWVSERPIPLAGFNLGKYKEATAEAGDVLVETYATRGVEKGFPSAPITVIDPGPNPATPEQIKRPPQVIAPPQPSPVRTEVTVAEEASRAIEFYAARFGPYPYGRLALTQMPGPESQGWPGLIFLSSYAFLSREEREALHFEPYRISLQQLIPAHETAHQWWGDLITWSSYRDQWWSEGLANYCALMTLEERDPVAFREIMEKYRSDLIEKNNDGVSPGEVGPVTLGTRLLSSRLPNGYEQIMYGRGTWLFHMLRTMLNDAAQKAGHQDQTGGAQDPFVRALRKIRERYEGKSISTQEMLAVFAEDLPAELRYEGKSSLEWFLNGWINGTSVPTIELKSVKVTPKSSGAAVSGTILQKDAPQDLVTSVPIYALVAGKRAVLLGRVFADGEESSFRLAAPAGTRKIVLDPNDTVLIRK